MTALHQFNTDGGLAARTTQRPSTGTSTRTICGCLVALVSLFVLTAGHGARSTHAQIKDGAGGGVLLDLKNPPAYSDQKPDDKVEDALALGNSARSAKPPRYTDAERAYRLAAKIGPRDPRPYIGLANIYCDQKRFQEATDAYMQALELVKLRPAQGGRLRRPARIRPQPGVMEAPAPPVNYGGDRNGEWHAYLGNALLQQGKSGRAGFEFRKAILQDPDNAQWHALLGQALLVQKRYSDAAASLKSAVELDPANAAYKELLEQSLNEQKKALLLDVELARSLEDTTWDISSERHGKMECKLTAGGKMACTSGMTTVRSGELWRVEGSFVHSYTTGSEFRCSGDIEGDRLTLNCEEIRMPSSQHPDGAYLTWKEIWTRRQIAPFQN